MKLNSTGIAIAFNWNDLWDSLLERNAKENNGIATYDPNDEDIFWHYGYGKTLEEMVGIQLAGYREDALIRRAELDEGGDEIPLILALLPYFCDLTEKEKEQINDVLKGENLNG